MKQKLYFFGFLLAFIGSPFTGKTQILTGLATVFDDSFHEWTIFYIEDTTATEALEGELALRWPMQGDWTVWDYRLGDFSGSIKQTTVRPAMWELRGDHHLVTAQPRFAGDYRSWRIRSNNQSFTLTTKWGNQYDEWLLDRSDGNSWQMFTDYENDPRDWIIEDYLLEEIPLPTKIMLLFLTSFYSSPKN